MTTALDAHLHLWDPSARHHGWLDGAPEVRRRFGPEDVDPGRYRLAGAIPRRAGLTFDVCVTHDQLPAVAGLVAGCPAASFVLDHLGKPPVAARRLDPWRSDLARLAAFPASRCTVGSDRPPPTADREAVVRGTASSVYGVDP